MIYAAIDIGLKRIGLALCSYKNIVFPQNAIIRKNRDQASSDLLSRLIFLNVDILVVGIPLGGSSEEEMKRRIKHFIDLLNFKGKIVYQDEYGSSIEAKEIMMGAIKQKKDGRIDSLAAKIILDRYLERTKK
jgi:putative Holliday junction resolvase